MQKFARFMSIELGLEMSEPKNYAGNTDRYVVYKSGPVLSVSVSPVNLTTKTLTSIQAH